MPRSVSGQHSKGRSEGARPASNHGAPFGGAFAGWRPGSRRNSKIPSEDGHSNAGGPTSGPAAHASTAAQNGTLSHSSSLARGDSRPAALDRHARMRMAMSEAQNDPIGGGQARSRRGHEDSDYDDEEDDEEEHRRRAAQNTTAYSVDGSESPRTKLAAGQARAHAAAAVAAAQKAAQDGTISAAREQGSTVNGANSGPSTTTKPGEGSLTFDLLGGANGPGGDVVLADGVPLSASGLQSSFNHTDAAASTMTTPPRPGMGPRSASASSVQRQTAAEPADLAAREPQRAASSLTVPEGMARIDDRGRKKSAHNMQGSASTSALSPGPFGRLRKLSDASSAAGGDASRSREQSPTKSRKSSAAMSASGNKKGGGNTGFGIGPGGIAAALAASGAGIAGYGVQDPRAYSRPHGNPGGQTLDKDYVGSSQGGVYRDPKSGEFVEKSEDGQEVRFHPGMGSRQVSKVSLSRKNSSSKGGKNANLTVPGENTISPSRRSSVSGHSLAESEGSDASGLGAAASFPAMQAGALLTPALSHAANAPGAPTIALDSANAEQTSHQGGGGDGHDGDGAAGADPSAAPASPNLNRGQDSAATSATVTSATWPVDMGAQITGFAVASSKRNADFHALFPTVPEDDYLIEDYGCAMVREILIQGRIYISENYICFNANIFGWVTNIVLAFSEIVSIEKRMTARIIPNAIQISTLHVKHTFSSFMSRDTTYDLMANIWKLSHPGVPGGVEVDVSDDESEAATAADGAGDGADGKGDGLSAADAKLGKRARLKKKLIGAKASKDSNGTAGGVMSAATNGSAKTDPGAGAGKNDTNGKAKKKAKHPKTSCPCDAEKKHMATVPLDTTYPCTPEKLFKLLFKDDFMKGFWTGNQKLFELNLGEWDNGKREFNYIKPLSGSIGPKQTKCLITDEEIHTDFDDYVTVMTTTRTPEVPAGGSFSVKTRTCLTWNGNGNVTRMFVSCATEWTGRSMLRSVIDKASIDGQKQYYGDLEKEVRKYIQEHPDQFKEEGDEEDEEDEQDAKAVADTGAGTGSTTAEEKKNSSDSTGANPTERKSESGGVLDQVMDIASTIGSTLGDVIGSLSELSPSMLILGSVVVLLVLTNIWALSSSGAGRGHQRDPLDPHRLVKSQSQSKSKTQTPAHAVEVANAVRDVLKDYLEPRSGATATGTRISSGGVTSIQDEMDHVKILMDEVEERMKRLRDEWNELSRRAYEGQQQKQQRPAPLDARAKGEL